MKTYPLTLILAFCVPVMLNAQSAATSPFNGAEVTVGYGALFTDISSVNKQLEDNGLPVLDGYLPGISIGGGVFINRLFFGGQATVYTGMSPSNAQYDTKLSGGNGLLKVGYVVLSGSSFVFYPVIGLGGGGVSYRVSEHADNSGADPVRFEFTGRRLHSGYMLVEPGLQADFFVGDTLETSRLLLGVSAGYQFSPFQSSWQSGDTKYRDFDKFAPAGIFAMIRVGLYIAR